MNISTLINLARQDGKIRSDRHLGNYLDISSASVSSWRRGYSTPDIQHTIKLCELSGIPPEVGLAWRNVWLAENEAKSICIRIAEEVTKNSGITLPSEAA